MRMIRVVALAVVTVLAVIGLLLATGAVGARRLTLFELLSLLVAAAGSAILIPTLVSLTQQTRAMRDQSEFLSIQIFSDNVLELDRVFIDRPEMRPYFYEGRDIEELDGEGRNRALAIAEFKLDVLGSISGVGSEYKMMHMQEVRRYIVRSFADSPVLCRYLRENHDVFGPELVRIMEDIVAGREGVGDPSAATRSIRRAR